MFLEKLVQRLVFPDKCVVCHRLLRGDSGMEEALCRECKRTVRPLTEPRCKRCSKPILDGEGELCGDCREREFLVERGMALYPYDDSMQKAIRDFKYEGNLTGGRYFGRQLLVHLGDWIRQLSPEVLVPVPIHKKRMRFRGFNQAEILARIVGGGLGIPVDTEYLVRTQNTKPQKELDLTTRIFNLRKSFAVTKQGISYQNVLLVDDIYTTGATLEACAAVLKQYGTQYISFLCLCIGEGE